jgi:3',5'-cyclic AMP phosphodiesterase CpdA
VTAVAVADMVCAAGRRVTAGQCHGWATADAAISLHPDAVLIPGDLQYEVGSARDFAQAYAPTWGRLRAITHPAPGNHEYYSDGADPYYQYFGAAAGDPGKGWYSVDLGAWHIVSLNSSCSQVGGCGEGSPQYRWLEADLAAHPARCTLAMWHHPRWSNSNHGDHEEVAPFTSALYAAGAEVILGGHDHVYERFEPRSPDGARDLSRGIRQFVVGMGGRSHYRIHHEAGLEAFDADTFGVLELTLRPDGYDWRFVPEAGGSYADAGSASCH